MHWFCLTLATVFAGNYHSADGFSVRSARGNSLPNIPVSKDSRELSIKTLHAWNRLRLLRRRRLDNSVQQIPQAKQTFEYRTFPSSSLDNHDVTKRFFQFSPFLMKVAHERGRNGKNNQPQLTSRNKTPYKDQFAGFLSLKLPSEPGKDYKSGEDLSKNIENSFNGFKVSDSAAVSENEESIRHLANSILDAVSQGLSRRHTLKAANNRASPFPLSDTSVETVEGYFDEPKLSARSRWGNRSSSTTEELSMGAQQDESSESTDVTDFGLPTGSEEFIDRHSFPKHTLTSQQQSSPFLGFAPLAAPIVDESTTFDEVKSADESENTGFADSDSAQTDSFGTDHGFGFGRTYEEGNGQIDAETTDGNYWDYDYDPTELTGFATGPMFFPSQSEGSFLTNKISCDEIENTTCQTDAECDCVFKYYCIDSICTSKADRSIAPSEGQWFDEAFKRRK